MEFEYKDIFFCINLYLAHLFHMYLIYLNSHMEISMLLVLL